MVKLEKYDVGKTVNLECDCSCGIVQIAHFDDPDYDDVSIIYYPLGFYAYNKAWKEKLKAIWQILTGKYFFLFDIIISREEFEEKMKEFMEK